MRHATFAASATYTTRCRLNALSGSSALVTTRRHPEGPASAPGWSPSRRSCSMSSMYCWTLGSERSMPISFALASTSLLLRSAARPSNSLRTLGSARSTPACLARRMSSSSDIPAVGSGGGALGGSTLVTASRSASEYSSEPSAAPYAALSALRCATWCFLCSRSAARTEASWGASSAALVRSRTASSRSSAVSSATLAMARRYRPLALRPSIASASLAAYRASRGCFSRSRHAAQLRYTGSSASLAWLRCSMGSSSSVACHRMCSLASLRLKRRKTATAFVYAASASSGFFLKLYSSLPSALYASHAASLSSKGPARSATHSSGRSCAIVLRKKSGLSSHTRRFSFSWAVLIWLAF
mmetsp:Transcript_8591/g.30060  ORF Transcript_8591/g.30060 Transcript_8591/m.30060 type:complete len:357 (+) Transcript_8591:684-1754(+)